jgi:hypothetical protein
VQKVREAAARQALERWIVLITAEASQEGIFNLASARESVVGHKSMIKDTEVIRRVFGNCDENEDGMISGAELRNCGLLQTGLPIREEPVSVDEVARAILFTPATLRDVIMNHPSLQHGQKMALAAKFNGFSGPNWNGYFKLLEAWHKTGKITPLVRNELVVGAMIVDESVTPSM